MKRVDCSVIILTYNTVALTISCIEHVLKSKTNGHKIEIIVCDNGSSDGTERSIKKRFPSVLFIQNKKNTGFAAGNNRGIKKARGRYVLLLNSDTEVEDNSIAEMIAFMDSHEKAGASTCLLQLPDGTMDPACHRGFPTPWASFSYFSGLERLFPRSKIFSGYHMGYKTMTVPHQVDSISGAFFMVRQEVIRTVGMLDESFFMYGEDIDWSYRIKEAGWEIWFNPSVVVLHKKKQSGRSKEDKVLRKETQKHFLDTMKLFYKKHYEKKYGRVIASFIYMGISVKRQCMYTFGE